MHRHPIVQKEKRIALEELVQRKREVLADIRIQKEIIEETIQNIIHPFNNINTNLVSPKKFNTGMAIIDGAMLGYSIIKKIRGFFKRKKK